MNPIFTVIMLTYNRPALLREAVEALQRQTYPHLEIIVLNNAATPETVAYLNQVRARDARIQVIDFKENQYRANDPHRTIHVCFNAGLRAATGDYVFYQNDDDLLAPDYVEKMVGLFQKNPKCITAAGRTTSIDFQGRVIDPEPRLSDYRSRYMPGHLLALDIIRGGRTLYGAPGSIYTIKREVLLKAGGYHRSIEHSHLYGIVPFGVTGFDESAILYWRRHERQFNRQMSASGWVGLREGLDLLQDWDIEKRWQVFGGRTASQVVRGLKRDVCRRAANWFAQHVFALKFKASFRILVRVWNNLWFWWEVSGFLRVYSKRAFISLIRRLLVPLIRLLFEQWPGLERRSAGLAKLRSRVISDSKAVLNGGKTCR